ncbi:hypothetical protein [Agathobaculum desmolans]|uniref:hypothetical protein n=1 Tax=Agathobaculum desmolans TaxID=39484 RepID=UPI0004E229DA|nr:hypothetical protein [Agathobaculum desmolans]
MMEEKAVHRYVRAVSRRLICSKSTRSKLLDGLQQELMIYSALSYDDLCEEIGMPEQIAMQIMDNIDNKEIVRAKRKCYLAAAVILAVFIVILIILGGYFIHSQQVMRNDFYVNEKNTSSTNRIVSDGMLDS